MSKAVRRIGKFVLPFLLWVFLFRDFLTGRSMISLESFYYYAMLKFYLTHLVSGVMPLWQPYVWWGFPLPIILVFVCVTNPFWLLIPLLQMIGVTSYMAYVVVFILYFFLGQLGFYCLAKAIFKDKNIAYVAFVLLLFSSFSFPLFSMVNSVLIYVPAVWFFFFKVQFDEKPEKKYFVGMILALMAALSGYLPLYFLTVFILVVLFALALWPQQSLSVARNKIEFFKKYRLFVLVCLLALTVTALPTLKAFQSMKEVIDPARGIKVTEGAHGFKFDGYARTTDGGLSARMTAQDLFSYLDHIAYGNDGFFFLSIFSYIILLLGIFLRVTRRFIFFLVLSVVIFFLSVGNATPVHRFLYDHVFYFKLMRNMHFILPFLLSTVILMICELWRQLQERAGNIFDQWKYSLAFVAIVHIGVIVFLIVQGNIIVTSFITVGLSFLLFVLLPVKEEVVKQRVVPILLFLCLTVQPAQVLWSHNVQARTKDTTSIREALLIKPGKEFSLTRLSNAQLNFVQEKDYLNVYYRHFLSNSDAPERLPVDHGFPVYGAYFLFKKLPLEAFEKYTRFKFFVYDAIRVTQERPLEELFAKELFLEEAQPALVTVPNVEAAKAMLEKFAPLDGRKVRQAMGAPTPEFAIKSFTVNSIRIETNFKNPRFLVYNDSYCSGWQATINGQKTEIFRTNLAFKGIYLPAGKNAIEFKFSPWGGEWIFILSLLLPLGMFVVFIFLSNKK